ncbi:hypothetical protein SCACP_25950 [Sporomusa carbonis]
MNKRNSEYYPDPTAAEALANVAKAEKVRPIIYVASPFAGDTERNAERARGYCRFVISKGGIPFAPHLLYPQFMDDSHRESRELGLFFALKLLAKCDELWVFGEQISEGMSREIAKARKRDLPIRYFSSRCEEVMSHGRSR